MYFQDRVISLGYVFFTLNIERLYDADQQKLKRKLRKGIQPQNTLRFESLYLLESFALELIIYNV